MSTLKRFFKRSCRAASLQPLEAFCRALLRYRGNLNYDYESNGESRVVRVAEAFGPTDILDVGAHFGTWATMARRHLSQDAKIYCVEPLPQACDAIRKLGLPNMSITNAALGAENGELNLNYYDGGEVLSSAYDVNVTPSGVERKVHVAKQLRGDDWIGELGISRADLMKIDVEGHELRVLEGFRSVLGGKKISAIQFEYGTVNIVSRALLRDFYLMFEDFGYRVGKIYPKHVDFQPYRFSMEDFIGPNFLAVDSSRPDLIRAYESMP